MGVLPEGCRVQERDVLRAAIVRRPSWRSPPPLARAGYLKIECAGRDGRADRGWRAVSQRHGNHEPFRSVIRVRAPGGRLHQSVSRRPPRQAWRRSGAQRRSMATTRGGSPTDSADSLLCIMPELSGGDVPIRSPHSKRSP